MIMKKCSRQQKKISTCYDKSTTAVEIKHISKKSEIPVRETLSLSKAGLDSLPGGGMEILDDVRIKYAEERRHQKNI